MVTPAPVRRGLADPTAATPNNLDALRLVLAAVVVYSHAYFFRVEGGQFGRDPLERATGVLDFTFGGLAVDAFFVLSGYLIAGSYLRSPGLGGYFAKRVLRIFPGFLVAFLLSVTLFAWLTYGTMNVGNPPAGYAARALTLKEPGSAFGDHLSLLNRSMWTIRPEFACYALVAGLGVVGLLRARRALAALALASLACFALASLVPAIGRAIERPYVLAQMPRLVTYFLLGVLVFAWRDRIAYRPGLVALALVVGAASCFHPVARCVLLPVALAFAVLGLGLRGTPGVRRAAALGDFSYGLYLYAFPVGMLVRRWELGLSAPAEGTLAVGLTLPFAVLSWHLVERPAMRWKASRARRTGPADDAVRVAPAASVRSNRAA